MHDLSKKAIKKLLPISLYNYALKNYSKKLLLNLKKGKLISKILQEKYFYKSKFKTTENTLDPRWDTESLIDIFLNKFQLITQKENKKTYKIIDMCAGTGVIGISLLMEIDKLRCEFVDISHKALQVCKHNIREHKVWHKSKVTKISIEHFPNKSIDFFVSNPPYLLRSEIKSNKNNLKHDPFISLYGGEDGLFFYKIIAKYIKINLKYFALIEIDHNRSNEIIKIFKNEKLKQVEIFTFNNLNRFLYCENDGNSNNIRNLFKYKNIFF